MSRRGALCDEWSTSTRGAGMTEWKGTEATTGRLRRAGGDDGDDGDGYGTRERGIEEEGKKREEGGDVVFFLHRSGERA